MKKKQRRLRAEPGAEAPEVRRSKVSYKEVAPAPPPFKPALSREEIAAATTAERAADALRQVGVALNGTPAAFEALRQAMSRGRLRPEEFLPGAPQRDGGFVPRDSSDLAVSDEVPARLSENNRTPFRAGVGSLHFTRRTRDAIIDSIAEQRIAHIPRNVSWDFSSEHDQINWEALQNYGGAADTTPPSEPAPTLTAASILETMRTMQGRVDYYPHGADTTRMPNRERRGHSWELTRTRVRTALGMRYPLAARINMLGPTAMRVEAELRGDNDVANVMRGIFLEVLDEPDKWLSIASQLAPDDMVIDAQILLENEAYLFLCVQNDGRVAESFGQELAEVVYQFSADGQLVMRHSYSRNEYRRVMDRATVRASDAAVKYAMSVWTIGRRQ